MRKVALRSAFALACSIGIGAHGARAYSQLCAGPDIPGVIGPVANGSSCQQTTSGTNIEAIYFNSEAADEDVVSLDGATLFDNRTTPQGGSNIASVTPGTLQFGLTNEVTNDSYFSATAYKNSGDIGGFSPVYHFAFFDVSNEADFDSLFGPGGTTGGITMSAAENAFILKNGGYSAFTFVGVEDLASRQWDDWNDLVFAFRDAPSGDPDPPPFTPGVPEPSTWAMMLVGLAGLAVASGRKARKEVAGQTHA